MYGYCTELISDKELKIYSCCDIEINLIQNQKR